MIRNIRDDIEYMKDHPEYAEKRLAFWIACYWGIAKETLYAWWYIIAVSHVLEGIFLG